MKSERTISAVAAAILLAWGCITGSAGTNTADDIAPDSVEGRAFVLDTFEEEASAIGTSWSVAVDQGGLGTRADFELAEGGARTTGTAGHFHGVVGKNRAPWPWATLALNWKVDYSPVDMSALRAIRFWVKGDGGRYVLKLDRVAAKDFANYQLEFTAPPQWTQVLVPVSEMTQPSWGVPVEREFSDSRQIQFAPTVVDGAFDLYVDDIELLLDPKKLESFPFAIGSQLAPVETLALSEIEKRNITYKTLSLSDVANMNFQDEVPGDGKGGWTDDGENSVFGFPTSRQVFQGVPFAIPEAEGRQVVVLRGKDHKLFPRRASIEVGDKAAAVYFLHANAWADLKNGSYRIEYRDGSSETVALRTGQEIFDFWAPGSSSHARVAWLGENPKRERIGLTLFAWPNPKPDVVIERIVAETPGNGAYLMIAGITLASAGPYLPPEPAIRFDTRDWFPYDGIHVAERRGTALDMSRYLEAPAGKHGRLGRRGEDFVFEDGTKIRFWGTSITDLMNAPSHEQAEFVAELCAQLGINMTRHHLMDAHWSTGSNIFRGSTNTQELDPEYLERFDYLIHQLQKRGIYQNFDFIAQRKPFAADGIQDADDVQPGYKMVGEFDERAIQLQQRFIAQLMNHENPYTGRRYAEDPAVVMAALNNESTLFFLGDWGQGELESQYHRKLLNQLYNRWLVAHFGDRAKLEQRWAPKQIEENVVGLRPTEDPAAGTVQHIMDFSDRTKEYQQYSQQRVQDNYRFIYDVETRYQKRMLEALRKTGYRGLVTHTNHWLDVPIHQYVNARLDWNDTHVYWAHPSVGYQYKAGTVFEAKPAIKAAKGLIHRIASRRVQGMPHLISEWNSNHPLYRNDAMVMMAAYSGLHNWSALLYSLGGNPVSESDQKGAKLDNVFDMIFQGSTLALYPATSRMLLRSDVKQAQGHYRPLSHDDVFDPASRVDLPEGLPFVTKSGMKFVGGEQVTPMLDALVKEHVQGSSARSTTGELFTDWERGIFTLDTPRSQAIVGFLESKLHAVSNLEVRLKNEFVTVVVTSLDEKSIARSSHLLITAVGNTINSGMELSEAGDSFKKGGRAPILIEPMLGTVTLRELSNEGPATVYHLNPSGKRMGRAPAKAQGRSLSFELLPRYKSMHYEVVR